MTLSLTGFLEGFLSSGGPRTGAQTSDVTQRIHQARIRFKSFNTKKSSIGPKLISNIVYVIFHVLWLQEITGTKWFMLRWSAQLLLSSENDHFVDTK